MACWGYGGPAEEHDVLSLILDVSVHFPLRVSFLFIPSSLFLCTIRFDLYSVIIVCTRACG